jgi:hypothetical protein
MMKRHLCLLAVPLLSIAACIDTSDPDSAADTSSQASAVSADDIVQVDTHVCESFGDQRCIGAPDLAFESPVRATATGRTLRIVAVTGGVHLSFLADTSRCVAVKKGSTSVEVRACSGVQSAVWTLHRGQNADSCMFKNTVNSLFLAGPNNGGQFNTVGANATGGWLKQFTIQGFTCPNP